MNETHTSILAHYREQSSAVDEVYAAAIVGLDTQIAALQVERDDLVKARDKAQAGLDDEACRRLHVKLDENECPVPRQGAPRKTKAAEPPALLPPGGTTDPAIVAGVAEASAILAAPAGEAPTAVNGVPINGYTPDGVPFGPGAAGGGVVQVFAGAIGSLPGEMTTAADAFIDAVSEPEATLLRNGFSREEIEATHPATRQKLRELGCRRVDVTPLPDGTWQEATF